MAIAAFGAVAVPLDGCGEEQAAVRAASRPAAAQIRPFSPQSFWNAPLKPNAAIDPNSAPMVAALVREVQSELARNYGPWINTRQYSAPVYTVRARQPGVQVELDRHLPALQAAISAVPIPPRARPARGSDRHMVVWQPATDRMWEFWRMRRRRGRWHAGAAGAMRHVSSNPGRFGPAAWPRARPWWGATATGLPLLGGLMMARELKRRRIDHALAMAIPEARRGVWSLPATHGDGNTNRPDALPEGARLRLDPQLDLDGLALPPVTRAIAEAAQRYGIVVRDRSGVVSFYGQDPRPLRRDPYPRIFGKRNPDELLADFPWDRLQVLKLHLRGAAR
jgi:hypothetical protein